MIAEPTTMKLPPIPLKALSEKTKDFILGRASYLKCSPEEVLVEVLDRASGSASQPQPEGVAA